MSNETLWGKMGEWTDCEQDKCACGAPLINGGCGNQILDLNSVTGAPKEIKIINPFTELENKLNEANKRIAELEAELVKEKLKEYTDEGLNGNLMSMKGFKACADVSFIPKTSE